MDIPSESRFTRWLRFPGVLVLALILAGIVAAPGLFIGLFVDDYYQLAVVEGLLPVGSPLDLFDFAPGDPEIAEPLITHGPLPWFVLPEMKARFFRPLASFLFWADHAIFDRAFVLWHAHSLVWYLLLVLGWGLVLRKTVPMPIAGFALLLFAIEDAHWFPATWLANRNALVATVPATWGLLAHLRWRMDGWRPGLPLSLAGYAVGLLGGESALGVLAYLAAYELILAPGSRWKRAQSLAPACVLIAAYLALYKALGYGAYGSGSYVDPLSEPLTYLSRAPRHILALIGAQLFGTPVDLWVFQLWTRPYLSAAGAIILVLFAALLRSAWRTLDPEMRRITAWLVAGALLALVPVAATFPTSRLLLTASMGGTVLLAIVLRHCWNQRKALFFRVMAYALIAIHVIVPPITWWGQSAAIAWFGKYVVRTTQAAEMGDSFAPGRSYILIVGPEPLTSIYTALIRAVTARETMEFGTAWNVISQAPYPHRVTRTGPNRIEVEVLGGSMFETEFEHLFRGPRFPLHVGFHRRLMALTVTVLEMSAVGPTKVAVDCDQPLESDDCWFLIWRDGRLRRFTPPPIGESVILPIEKGLLSAIPF